MIAERVEAPLRIMIVDDNINGAAWTVERLMQFGCCVCSIVEEPFKILKLVAATNPQILMINMQTPGREILESVSVVVQQQPIPVVMFSGQEDPAYIERAISAGVSIYLVGNLDPCKVRPVIDAATAQFGRIHELQTALAEAKSELHSRRQIDQAKFALMKWLNIDEEEAYRQMRSAAMSSGESLTDIAQKLLARLQKSGKK